MRNPVPRSVVNRPSLFSPCHSRFWWCIRRRFIGCLSLLNQAVLTQSHTSRSAIQLVATRSSRSPSKLDISYSKLILIPASLPLPSIKMELESLTTLVLCGKSRAENEFANILKTNSSLKLPDNAPINVVLHSDIEKLESFQNCGFKIDSYMNSLSTSEIGKFLIYSPKLASTHDIVSHNFCELPIGTVCVADVQLRGRGRSNNAWESPKGCLLFSFTIQMEDGRVVPLVQYVVSLAMTEAINDVCLQKGIAPLNVRIKWPNDLYLDGLKVGGILCTSKYRSKKFNVSAGIGLNVSNEKPTTCLNAVTQRLTSSAPQLQREEIIAAFFNKFENFYSIFINQGFHALEELYYKTWLHSGQRVIVQEKNENQDQISESVVTIQGITGSGYLLAVTEDGQECELHPDGNSFDFFKGLVRSKLG